MPPQVIANALIAGSGYALVALGFSLIYAVTRFFHFAHGAVYASAAYVLFLLVALLHTPLALAVPLAVLVTTLVGAGMDRLVYRPLRNKYASALILLIASLGLYVIVQNGISLAFGDDVKTLRAGAVTEGLPLLGARITPIQLLIILAAAVLFIGTSLIVSRTKFGKAMRAVANDPELARVTGIDADRAILFAFALGSALAAIAAILISFDTDMVPTMGMRALLMGVVATIIGGVGSIPGAALGGLLLGLAQHLGTWHIGAEWQDSIAFAVLLAFLLFRPYGIFGRKLRKAEV